MRVDRKRFTSVKISKAKTKKIGVRSISDIIHNTPELNLKQKISYIRHKYSYYDGNYELFHTANGKPNSRKSQLNYLITEIVLGKKDPNELKQFNTLILKWRKEYEEKRKQLKTNILNSISLPFDNNISWREYYKNNFTKDDIIDAYLKYNQNIIKPEILEKISYKDLKTIATKWNKDQQNNTYIPINSLEDYITKISQKTSPEAKPYLSLIIMYLEEEGHNYDLEELEMKKYKHMKSIAINWAANKKANNNFDDSKLPDLVRNVIKERADNIVKQENMHATACMKKWAIDCGYITEENLNVAA